MIRVAICDDHPVVLEGVGALITSLDDMELAGSFERASGLMEFLKNDSGERADTLVLLLDIHLKDADGAELCAQLSKSYPNLGIIGFSSMEEPAVISTMLKKGAKSFVLKTTGAQQLTEAIRETAAGRQYLSPEIVPLLLGLAGGAKTGKSYLPSLSRREKEVLGLIVKEYTTQEIAEALFISVNTVETHRNNLLQKLGVKNVAGLVREAIEKGLID
ncbi:MAG: response regulator transcription factor [Flavobacteriales bacterium]|nr:response regulator transcription factor [Flavobacteriales bacterium]